MGILRPNFIVGIGGSAGSLNAFRALLGALPPNTGMAFVFVSHMLPTATSFLAEILSNHTKMPVMVPSTAMLIRANHVYVSPPNADLLIDGFTFKVVSPRSRGNAPIDLFLTSLAKAMEERAIGIILSGSLSDGTEGCKRIKSKGGTTFAQDESAEVSGMPLSAQASGCVDFVLPPDRIPDELQRLARASYPGRRSALKKIIAPALPSGPAAVTAEGIAEVRHQEALLKPGALQSAIFSSANFSSIATDAKGVIQIFNAGAERMLGYASADVTNKITPADISDPQELIARAKALSAEFSMPIAPGFEAMVFKASRGIEDIYELTYVRKDGSRFPAVVSVTALHDAHNAIIGYLLIATDNTARKQVEAEQKMIMGLTRDVTERQKAAEAELLYARVTMQRELVASVSHELGTPISAILASVETLLGKGENARTRRRFLRVIENHAKRLADIVKNLLLVAELESGTSKPVPSSIPLAAFLKEFLPGITGLAKKKSVSISTKVVPGLVLLADRSHLTGIFQNLLDNAIKYNKKNGSIKIMARRNANGYAEVSVRDTGIGIPAAELPLVFHQFHRAVNARELRIAGTGLGLYIIKTMVDSNGGRIWVENAKDEGAIFTFTLPSERERSSSPFSTKRKLRTRG